MNSYKEILKQKITSIEISITDKCTLNCKYCYKRYDHATSRKMLLNPKDFRTILTNIREDFPELDRVNSLELFGGEPLLDYDHFIKIRNEVEKDGRFKELVVPTNARLLQSISDYDIERLIDSSVRVIFSLSVDGNDNRPLSKLGHMLLLKEENLDRLFHINKKFGFGFHPMLDFSKAEDWFAQFKKFFDRGMIPYLLEIRHPVTMEQIKQSLISLIKIRKYVEKTLELNISRKLQLNTIFYARCPRGLCCSALNSFTVMINGDLPFCHRLIERPFIWGNIFTRNYDFEIFEQQKMFDHRNTTFCMSCPLKDDCPGGCIGAQWEYWKNPFIPIPSVCTYMHLKFFVFGKLFDDFPDPKETSVVRKYKDVISEIFKEVQNEV